MKNVLFEAKWRFERYGANLRVCVEVPHTELEVAENLIHNFGFLPRCKESEREDQIRKDGGFRLAFQAGEKRIRDAALAMAETALIRGGFDEPRKADIETLASKILSKLPAREEQEENAIQKTERRGRKPAVFDWPQGEFRLKELAEKIGVTVTTVYLKAQAALGNELQVVRHESSGRGKPAAIYCRI